MLEVPNVRKAVMQDAVFLAKDMKEIDKLEVKYSLDETPLDEDSAGANPIIVLSCEFPFIHKESAAKNEAPPPIEWPIKAVLLATML